MDYDTYEPYEDDLLELSNREAWEDAQAEMESDYEYPELSDDLGDDFNDGWEHDEW